ncbi:MAG: DUF4912 domain-containing protein [Leptospirales bacterium]
MFQKEWQRETPSSSDYFFPPHEPLPDETRSSVHPLEGPWASFLHIPYEPEPIEKTPDILLLPVDPYRIWAGIRLFHPVYDRQGHLLTQPVLKIYDITSSRQHGDRSLSPRADYSFELDLGQSTTWYAPLWSSGRTFYARLGHIIDGQFEELARSNEIRTPRGKVQGTTKRFLHFFSGNYPDQNPVPLPQFFSGRAGNVISSHPPFSDFPFIGQSSSGSSSR